MDFSRLLVVGQVIQLKNIQATVDLTSVSDFERKYRLRFEDGSHKWVNQSLVRHMLVQN